MTRSDPAWMLAALACAQQAYDEQEVPIGAVLVLNNTLLAYAWNRSCQDCDPTAHAEILVLRQACAIMGNYRLPGATLYTTLEPCAMCAGAMVHARIQRCVAAADDPRSGAAGSVMRLLDHASLNHRVVYQQGVMQTTSRQLLEAFFKARRQSG